MPAWLNRLPDLPWEAVQLLLAGGKLIPAIAILSIAMWLLILLKLLELRRLRRERLLWDSPGDPPANEQGWVAALLADFQSRRCLDAEGDKLLLRTLFQKKSAEAGRYVPTILAFASVAPLLGLLGTVSGMISTFDAITMVGTGNPRPMASGISEALITTLCGLAVAIPGIMMGSYLQRRVQRFQVRIEALSLRLCRLHDTDAGDCAKKQGGEV